MGVEQVHGGGVQQQAEEVGHEAVATQAVHLQAVLEFVHALFAFAALDVVVVLALAVGGPVHVGPVGDHEAEIGSLRRGTRPWR